MDRRRSRALAISASAVIASVLLHAQATSVPRAWDDNGLREWATPVAGLNVRPAHFSEADYYKAPIDNLRTYPVYYPGREPAGYWEMLQTVGAKPLVEPALLLTEDDWIRAGKRVFEEFDGPTGRVFASDIIAAVRRVETFASRSAPRPDGTLPDLRWYQPTAASLSASAIARSVTFGGSKMARSSTARRPTNAQRHRAVRPGALWGLGNPAAGRHAGDGHLAIVGGALDCRRCPRVDQDDGAGGGGGADCQRRATGLFPRWNGSGYYPTKIPDLIGFKDRKTSTTPRRTGTDGGGFDAICRPGHLQRHSDFGPHRLLTDAQRNVPLRLPDEALYAMAIYIYSLKPPRTPTTADPRIPDGERIFRREGCASCHTPPLYTNNKVTPAQGFVPPAEHAQLLEILPISVGTDPGLALKTRKGTGYYKVPSLKGLWYRGRYLHDGSLTSLEEMFDPARLSETFVPSGFMRPGQTSRAVTGHEFGIRLNDSERAALIAFLRSL